MSKDVKIVIGANYGDEGKGLLTHHFAKNANGKVCVVFHNGTAQRGHTVDLTDHRRHVFHHFSSGTYDNASTYFADTFWIHPMEFAREALELKLTKPDVMQSVQLYYHPQAKVITPFDMMVDRATEEWIALQHDGQREYGSCAMGTWCATDRCNTYSISDWSNANLVPFLLKATYVDCMGLLEQRGVDIEQTSFKPYFEENSIYFKIILDNFASDLLFFKRYAKPATFKWIYNNFDTIIFENGQGLGLDQYVNNEWHTTSNTGLVNPVSMLSDFDDFNAEVCYVTRSYLTRHGVGPLEDRAYGNFSKIPIIDKTNQPNEFQGSLRFGYVNTPDQRLRISKDWGLVANNPLFYKTIAVTHTNEFDDINFDYDYFSDNPFTVTNMK